MWISMLPCCGAKLVKQSPPVDYRLLGTWQLQTYILYSWNFIVILITILMMISKVMLSELKVVTFLFVQMMQRVITMARFVYAVVAVAVVAMAVLSDDLSF